jgi:hypothetical protein
MSVGGDGYDMFIDLPVVAEGGNQDELLIAYLLAHDISNIGIEGRIINLAATDYVVVAEEVANVEAIAEVIEAVEIIEVVEVVEIEAVVTTTAPAGATQGVVTGASHLNVRQTGNPSANILNVVSEGDVITILETNSWNWHNIQFGNVSGWVYGGYVVVSGN